MIQFQNVCYLYISSVMRRLHQRKVHLENILRMFWYIERNNKLTSYGESNGLSNANPQSIDKRGHAIWTHLEKVILWVSYDIIYYHTLTTFITMLFYTIFKADVKFSPDLIPKTKIWKLVLHLLQKYSNNELDLLENYIIY